MFIWLVGVGTWIRRVGPVYSARHVVIVSVFFRICYRRCDKNSSSSSSIFRRNEWLSLVNLFFNCFVFSRSEYKLQMTSSRLAILLWSLSMRASCVLMISSKLAMVLSRFEESAADKSVAILVWC